MQIAIVCVPYQTDVARWGCARGPQAFLEHGLMKRVREQRHRVREPVWIELPKAERTRDTVTNLGNIARRTAAAVSTALKENSDFVLVLAGDCTHALGPIGGLAQAQGAPGVVWFDAHGDMNTRETTTSGLWGGMPYAVALGWDLEDWRLAAGLDPPVRPEAAALVGASDLDDAEIEALQHHPILRMDAVEMMEPGVAERLSGALRKRAGETEAWYLHMDLDVAGPEELPGGMTPAPSWPPRQHLLEAVRATMQSVPVMVASIAVYNPSGDRDERGLRLGLDIAMAMVSSR